MATKNECLGSRLPQSRKGGRPYGRDRAEPGAFFLREVDAMRR